jgi:recombination associated protein RdgC
MFKNIKYFAIKPTWVSDLAQAEAALAEHRFVECGASQEQSIGWLEPRGEAHGPLIEAVGGQWVAKFRVETKILPGSVVKEQVEKRLLAIEQETGNKPSKKDRKDATEDVRNSLLAQAFAKKLDAMVWIDPLARRLVVESVTQSRADEIITALVKALEGFAATPIQTAQSAEASMAIWLDTQEVPDGFSADRDCVLKSTDESKASVSYAKHALDIDEVRGHIANGKSPSQLAMTWDSRVSFVLTDTGALKKIDYLDVVMDDKGEGGFDADVAIATGELGKLIPALILALGGETL